MPDKKQHDKTLTVCSYGIKVCILCFSIILNYMDRELCPTAQQKPINGQTLCR